MALLSETIPFRSETLAFPSETCLICPETFTFSAETWLDVSEGMTGPSETFAHVSDGIVNASDNKREVLHASKKISSYILLAHIVSTGNNILHEKAIDNA